MERLDKALAFAARAHEGQTRKGTDIPYITHPFAVGLLLQQADCSEDVVIAGILHDVMEDTDTTFEELSQQFGMKVAELVRAVSEADKSLPWRDRKQQTINSIAIQPFEAIQIIAADKYHNALSIHADYRTVGEAVWARFNRGKEDQCWYYSEMVRALSPYKKEFPLIGLLEKEVAAVFREKQTPQPRDG